MNKTYYAVIPASVRYDKSLRPNAKLLYGEITALCNEKGYCWASNSYFADLYNVSTQAISRWIRELEEYDHVKIEYIYNGKEIKERRIYIIGVSTTGLGGINKKLKGYQQKVKENNTVNSTYNNIYEKTQTSKKRFVKPSIEDIKAYCIERNNSIDSIRFYNFYESKGWMVGKNKMKDWKACVRTWEQNDNSKIKQRTAYLDLEEA